MMRGKHEPLMLAKFIRLCWRVMHQFSAENALPHCVTVIPTLAHGTSTVALGLLAQPTPKTILLSKHTMRTVAV